MLKLLFLAAFVAAIFALLRGSPNTSSMQQLFAQPATTPAFAKVASLGLLSPIRTANNPAPGRDSGGEPDRIGKIMGADWFLNQTGGGFTVQLKSSTSYSELMEFASDFPNSSAIAIFPYKRNQSSQLIYGLSHGQHDSYASAIAETQNLPSELRVNEPWVRSITNLKTKIQALGEYE